ncbi:hypothetical protein ABZ070_34635, partial [Streptomyces sp. NPDC006283]
LVEGYAEHADRIDDLIATYAVGWTIDRMPCATLMAELVREREDGSPTPTDPAPLSRLRGHCAVAVAGGALLIPGVRTVLGAAVSPVPMPVALGAGIIPLAAGVLSANFPARARTVLGSGTGTGALAAVALNLFFHHLGTRSRTAVALKFT